MKRSWIGNILLDPKAEAAGNGSNKSGNVDVDNGVMSAALNRLNLSPELMADFGASAQPLGEEGEGKAEGEGEAGAEGDGEGEGEQEGEGDEGQKTEDGEGSEGGEGEGEGEEKPGEEGAAPELTPEQKTWVDAQITAATEKATAAEKTVEELTGLVNSLRQKPVEVASVHPLMLADDMGAIEKAEAEFSNFEKWALENWDGTDEIPAEGDQKAVPAYSKEQIRARYTQLKQVKETIIPQAKQHLQWRAQWDGVVKQMYPALLDTKSKDFAVLEAIIRQAPGLKAIFPNYKVIIGDAIVGEKIRLEKAKARKASGGKTPVQPAPKVPVRPSPASRTQLAPKPKADRGISVKRFMEGGADRNSLVTMLAGSDLV